MFLTNQHLEDPKKIQNLREKGRTFFRTIIDPASTDTLENIILRREAAGEEASALRESLEIYRGIQRKLESFPPEEQQLLLELLDTVSEEVFLSSCTYQVYDLDYQQQMIENQCIFSSAEEDIEE